MILEWNISYLKCYCPGYRHITGTAPHALYTLYLPIHAYTSYEYIGRSGMGEWLANRRIRIADKRARWPITDDIFFIDCCSVDREYTFFTIQRAIKYNLSLHFMIFW